MATFTNANKITSTETTTESNLWSEDNLPWADDNLPWQDNDTTATTVNPLSNSDKQ